MALGADIVASYRDAGPVLRRRRLGGQRDAEIVGQLLIACVLIFLAQWPRLLGIAASEPSISFEELMGGALLGWVFLAPLAALGLAALTHLALLPFGATGGWQAARAALSWALMVSVPLWMLSAVVTGLDLPKGVTAVIGLVSLAGFLWIWGRGLWALEFPGRGAP